jgi:hypothetical protein
VSCVRALVCGACVVVAVHEVAGGKHGLLARHYFSPDCRRPWRHERGRIATDGPTSLHARSRSSILLCCRSAAAAAEAEAEEELLVSCS